MAKAKWDGKNVLVTTAHRGVFFGKLVGETGAVVTLKDARNCVYWTADVKGFLGLAKNGPSRDCRIGPAVSEFELRDVTSIALVEDEAATKWEKHPWSM